MKITIWENANIRQTWFCHFYYVIMYSIKMSQICIISKQLAFFKFLLTTFVCLIILARNYNSPRTISVKVLTLPVTTEPTLCLWHVTVSKTACANTNVTSLKKDFVLQALGFCTDYSLLVSSCPLRELFFVFWDKIC